MQSQQKASPAGRTLLLIMRILFTLCLGATVVFIFANSAEIGDVSQGRSLALTVWYNRFLTNIGVSLTEHMIRKLAHFTEYMLLGFWLMLTLRVYTRRMLSRISWLLFFGLLIPVLDESFQLLIPGRSGQVTDVLIDFGGVLVGLAAGLFVWLLARAIWDRVRGRVV